MADLEQNSNTENYFFSTTFKVIFINADIMIHLLILLFIDAGESCLSGSR